MPNAKYDQKYQADSEMTHVAQGSGIPSTLRVNFTSSLVQVKTT
jgi:hypothetical protein